MIFATPLPPSTINSKRQEVESDEQPNVAVWLCCGWLAVDGLAFGPAKCGYMAVAGWLAGPLAQPNVAVWLCCGWLGLQPSQMWLVGWLAGPLAQPNGRLPGWLGLQPSLMWLAKSKVAGIQIPRIPHLWDPAYLSPPFPP